MRVALFVLLLGASCAHGATVAKNVCDTLQKLPEQRRVACCHREGGSDLAVVCTRELDSALARGTIKLDPARADACAAATSAALEGCGWVGPLLPPPPAQCAQLIEGTLAAGASCRSSLECRDGLHCRGVTPGGAGTCAAPAAVGSACENPADNLVSLTRAKDDPRHPVCDGACVKGQCLARIAEGDSCPSTAACLAGLHCLSGKCVAQPLPKLGEACGAQAECGDGSVCADAKCIKPKDAGESCKLPFECRSLACDKRAGAATGTCTDVCG
jgi:hypothetical protein